MHASCPVNSTHQLETGDQEVLMKNEQQSSSTTTTTTSTITDDHAAASPSTGSSTPDIKPSPADQAPAARRKRALLCGVTYGMEENRRPCLRGPINDVNGIKNMLIQPPFEFPAKNIRVLMEENGNHHDLPPTRKNIEDSLKWLVEGSESGDSLVFYFSGHGDHGFTEYSSICPADYMDRGKIRNNYINSTIVRPLKEGVTLHAIVDACYSGNLLDLKYKYDLPTSNINQAAGTWIDKKPADQQLEADKLGTSGGLAICLSACEDDRTAPETNALSPGKEIMGVFTHNLIKIVSKKKNHDPEIPDVTYKDIHQQLLELHVTYNNESAPLAEKQKGCLGQFSKQLHESKRMEKPVLSSSSSLEPGGVLSKKFLL